MSFPKKIQLQLIGLFEKFHTNLCYYFPSKNTNHFLVSPQGRRRRYEDQSFTRRLAVGRWIEQVKSDSLNK